MTVAGCSSCICRECMLWWSSRCPYGGCFDDRRAKQQPYDAAHPDEPPRTSWTEWKNDQAHWCRGGVFYPAETCEHFVKGIAAKVRSCLLANISEWPDGYIDCPIVENTGCEECYRRYLQQRGEICDEDN